MTISGDKLMGDADPNSPTINLIHLAFVAPWLYYLSTGPEGWAQYLKLTAGGVAAYHFYRAYCKAYYPQDKKPQNQPGQYSVLPLMF